MEPLTYQRIEDSLRNLINQERKLVKEFAISSEDYAEAEVAFKLRYAQERAKARSYYRTQGIRFNEGMVEDAAQEEAADEFREYTVTKTKRESLKQSLSSVRAQMDAMRSLMASHRELSDAAV